MDRFTAIYYILQGVGGAISAIAHLIEVTKGKGHDTSTVEPALANLQDAHSQLTDAVKTVAGVRT